MDPHVRDLGAASWRKSSYSNISGGDCLEIAEGFLGVAQWRKSSYSNTAGGDCVELADNLPGIVPVRDSKVPAGPVVIVPPAAWSPFIEALKSDSIFA